MWYMKKTRLLRAVVCRRHVTTCSAIIPSSARIPNATSSDSNDDDLEGRHALIATWDGIMNHWRDSRFNASAMKSSAASSATNAVHKGRSSKAYSVDNPLPRCYVRLASNSNTASSLNTHAEPHSLPVQSKHHPSTPLPEPKQSDLETKHKQKSDYLYNVGIAIRTLQGELPLLFETGLTNLDIYHPDIVFIEPHHTGFSIKGRRAYALSMTTLKGIVNLCFGDVVFDILKMTQSKNSASGDGGEGEGGKRVLYDDDLKEPLRVLVRWVFEGTPRPQLIASGGDVMSAPRSTYEGLFVYTFDMRTGRIIEHRIAALHPAPPILSLFKFAVKDAPSPGFVPIGKSGG
ncbi:hypothetical protein SeMB42_g06976 [Synchytrium endobioticum]|uniref:Uncharacterized protein n=1 Tax=Synchytrium endobioticum TaxID=286115 RepID=A0A507C9X0_9FUNG|nr:hypothetical protein SeLEV6574_g08252 [Synchytrium endobioticum]TPX37253.1 hypothetical protein SeMB42_g06976 [Synchytrium endobioticum]